MKKLEPRSSKLVPLRGTRSVSAAPNTKNPKCIIKGNIDKSTDTHIYYVPGCAQYNFTVVEEDIGEQWFCSESEARKAGYVKSKTCK